MGAKSTFNKEKFNNFCISSVNNSFQCFFKRMRSFLPRAQDWEIMNIVRKQMLYKCFGIEGSKICDSDFYLNASISSIHTSSNGQYSCPFIFSKHEGYPQGYLSDVSKDIWNYLLVKGITITTEYLPVNLNKETDFQSRSSERLKRMEVGLQSFSNNMLEM